MERFCAGNLNPTFPPPTLPTNINYGKGVIKTMDPFFVCKYYKSTRFINIQLTGLSH